MGATIIEREQWGAQEPSGTVGFQKTPVANVVMVWTDQLPCRSRADCGLRVQELQRMHIAVRNLPDIRFNFVVGGDGNVYVGRGWQRAPTPVHKSVKGADLVNGKAIHIGAIELAYRTPLTNCVEAFSEIVSKGVVKNHLTSDVKMYILRDDELMLVGLAPSQLKSDRKLSLF